MTHEIDPWITNDATLFGILAAMLGGIFLTAKSENPFWKKLYIYPCPAVVLFFTVFANHL